MSNSSRPPGLMNLVGHVQVRHMIAGMSGGVVSTLLLHPLDLLKIRYLSVILQHILTPSFTDLPWMMEAMAEPSTPPLAMPCPPSSSPREYEDCTEG